MLEVRKANARGLSRTDWLTSFHTFSFANYYDPKFVGFGDLLVINEDYVKPGFGFGAHPHKNMEIVTYIVSGELEHKDDLGTGSIIKRGEIQRMTAGTGIRHSEYNHSHHHDVHLLQIWIIPDKDNLQPGYEQKPIKTELNKFILLASNQGENGAVKINQNAELYVAYMTAGEKLNYRMRKTRRAWLQLIKGEVSINGIALSAGDGLAITAETMLEIECMHEAEFLYFDLR